MKLEDFQKLVEEKLRTNSRVPRTIRMLVADCLDLAYQMGQDGEENTIELPQSLSDDAMIAKFLETNSISVHEPTPTDPTQTGAMRQGG